VELYFLTAIEKLDSAHPGLVDDVCVWFTQGLPVRRVTEMVMEKYNVKVTRSAVAGFRTKRWVPQQRMLCEKRLNVLAQIQVQRELAVKAGLAQQLRGEQR
jgi:hypothetical protein